MKSSIVSVLVVFGAVAGVRYVIESILVREQVRQVVQRADDPSSKPVVSVADGKVEWMLGCDTGELNGANFNQTEYCGCVYDKLVANHGVNWLINVGLNDTEEQAAAKMDAEINQCVDEQGLNTL